MQDEAIRVEIIENNRIAKIMIKNLEALNERKENLYNELKNRQT